jgi:hypothetical protein
MTAAFLQEYHSAISCVYIEAGRTGVRLAAGVQLPPLTAPPPDTTNGQPEAVPPSNGHGTTLTSLAPEITNAVVPDNGTIVPSLVTIPPDAGLPCGGQAISALKPAQLAMLISKTARLLQDEGGGWVPLLHALERERNARLAHGRKTVPTSGEG